MKSKLFKNLLLFGLPAFGIFLVWNFVNKLSPSDKGEIIASFKSANYWWVLLSLFFGALSHLSRAYRWKFMIEPLNFKPKFPNLVLTVLIAYLINLIFPRAGEVARASALTKYEKVPFEKGFGTIISERIADVIMLLSFTGIAFLLQGPLIKSYLISEKSEDNNTPLILFLILITLIIATYFVFKKSKNSFVLKIKNFAIGLFEGLLSIFKMKKKWAFIFHTLFIWFMYVLMFYVVTFAIPETSNLPLEAIIVGFIAGALSMAITNGGLGVYPVAVAGAFALYGVDYNHASAFGWIMWTAQTLMILLFGGLSFLTLPIYNKEK